MVLVTAVELMSIGSQEASLSRSATCMPDRRCHVPCTGEPSD